MTALFGTVRIGSFIVMLLLKAVEPACNGFSRQTTLENHH
jgi:hypothetical protein